MALPHYDRRKRITGIDLSTDMLARARCRVREQRLSYVESLLEVDAEATGLDAGSFDVAVAMFVASVVPNPRRLLAAEDMDVAVFDPVHPLGLFTLVQLPN